MESFQRILSLSLALVGLTLAGAARAADALQARIYWLEFTGLHSANPDGSDAKTLVALNQGPDGVAVDLAAGKVYWTNMGTATSGSGSLQRANLDGSHVEYIVPKGGTSFAKQLQLDLVHGKAYWCDREGSKVERCNLDGSALEVLVDGLDRPVGMYLDIAKDVFYFSEKDGGTLKRAPMSLPKSSQTAAKRTDVETLFLGLHQPIDLAIDLPKGRMYWTDREDGTVYGAGTEIPAGQTASTRKDRETLLSGLRTPIGLALDSVDRKLYTTESETGAIFRCNLDGTGKETVIPARANAVLTGICFAPAMASATAIALGEKDRLLPAAWVAPVAPAAPSARFDALGKSDRMNSAHRISARISYP
jgi:sugar lactone lactonase YvrE